MPKVVLNNLQFNFMQSGNGPDVILIHGLGANLAFWNLRIVGALNKQFHVTTYDLRGHGYSDMPPQGYTTSDMVADLEALLDSLGLQHVHVVGHSFGGEIALKFALAHPDRVNSLTLADAVIRALYHLPPNRQWNRRHQLNEILREWGISLHLETLDNAHILLAELADPRWYQLRKRRKMGNVLIPFALWDGRGRNAKRWRNLLTETTALTDFEQDSTIRRDDLKNLHCPTLAIFGELSRYFPTTKELQVAVPNCQLVVIPGVGHFHPFLRPQVFADHLRRFLQESSQLT